MNNLRPVLVVTSLHDPTADVVIRELHDRDVPVVRLDSGDFPASLSVEAEITSHGLQGRLRTPSRTVGLADVRALYYRRPTGFAFPHLDERDTLFAITQARYGLGGVLASLPGCLYVNHPHRIGDAEFKPSGLAAAVAAGFLVPPTLVTSSPEAARAFIERQGSVIYKPLHNPVYRVDGISNVVKVAEVSAADIDDGVAGTAHLFQSRIPKTADVRATVIGDHVFCVRIDSDLLDWRTDYGRLTYAPVEPPHGIVPALHRYLDHFGLVFGAFDFCVAEDGRWWFLECNPSGQWYWLEPETGLPMCAALADLLEGKGTT
ncbi:MULTISPECIES: ATP-grasp ribosomal peptide maturase [Streptomyces]|uniref:ATP-grasp ribosomal peptide maturase n=1 Tax=Streptomyces griseiscabiei TaxID=2993540 RepID=A0ABU4KWG2_9ACTN|nr:MULTISPECIES: ATP-grasp ribosomal peptide maturase [Streptomyces]MBZ3900507.1 ATP-grasp ribosomal peptide maturase [Streptomyces griseiscabiei]MDX2907822.1 ATP-grasp ribosomal peptide maturase [Streptomyces griseiscabiei]